MSPRATTTASSCCVRPKIEARNSESSEGFAPQPRALTPSDTCTWATPSDACTWAKPAVRSRFVRRPRNLADMLKENTTSRGSNVLEWSTSATSASVSPEYGSVLDDAITMSLSECSSDGGGGGSRLARRRVVSPFNETLASLGKLVRKSGGNRLKSAEKLAPPGSRGGGTMTPTSTMAPFCGGADVKGPGFFVQPDSADVMAQQPAPLQVPPASSPSTPRRLSRSRRPALQALRPNQHLPDDGYNSSSSSSAESSASSSLSSSSGSSSSRSSSSSSSVLKLELGGSWDDIAATTVAGHNQQSKEGSGRIGSFNLRLTPESPRALLPKSPHAPTGILRGRDERRRLRQLRQQQLGARFSPSDLNLGAWGYWAKHLGSRSARESPKASSRLRSTVPSSMNCKLHAFESLRSNFLSGELSATESKERQLGRKKNVDPERSTGRGATNDSSPSSMSSRDEPMRHPALTHGSWAERLPEDDAQRAGPSDPQVLPRSPMNKNAPGKEVSRTTVVGSRWKGRSVATTDRRSTPTDAAAGAGIPASTADDVTHGLFTTTAHGTVAGAVAKSRVVLAPARHFGGGGGGGIGSGGGDLKKRENDKKWQKTRFMDGSYGRDGFVYVSDHDHDEVRARRSAAREGGRRPGGQEGRGVEEGTWPGGREGKGARDGRGRGAGASDARSGNRGCGTVEGSSRGMVGGRRCATVKIRGHPNNIWPSSPSSTQPKVQSNPRPRAGTIWDDDVKGSRVPPIHPSLLLLKERRLRAHLGVGARKEAPNTALLQVGGSRTSDFVGVSRAPPLSGRAKIGQRLGRECTYNNSRSTLTSSNNSNKSSGNYNNNNNNNNAVNQTQKWDFFNHSETWDLALTE